MLSTLVVVQAMITVLPGVLGWFMERDLGPSASVMVLLLVQLPILGAFRHAVRTRREGLFSMSLVALTVTQGLWIQAVFVDTLGGFSVLGAVLLVGLSAAWAFNDAQCLYDDLVVRLAHAAPVLIFDGALLLLDALGGQGLIALWETNLVALETLLLTQLLALGLSQMILGSAGALNRRHHAAVDQLAAERRQAEVERAERDFVRRVGDLLTSSLSVGRFSHDVAGPLMVIQSASDELEECLAGTDDPVVTEILQDLRHAGSSLAEMVSFMNRCLRGEHHTEPLHVGELVGSTRRHVRELLRAHGIDGSLAELDVEFEPGIVRADALQATALANVAANGVLNSRQQVAVRGVRLDAQTYRLTVRDLGVDGAARVQAVDRIQTSLDLTPRPASTSGSYRGHGLGLVLARMISVRNGGELSVEVPRRGPGVMLHLDLALVSPSADAVGESEPATPVGLPGRSPAG